MVTEIFIKTSEMLPKEVDTMYGWVFVIDKDSACPIPCFYKDAIYYDYWCHITDLPEITEDNKNAVYRLTSM